MKSFLRYLPRQHGYIQAQVAVAVQAPACPGVGAQNLCRVIRCQAAALFLAYTTVSLWVLRKVSDRYSLGTRKITL